MTSVPNRIIEISYSDIRRMVSESINRVVLNEKHTVWTYDDCAAESKKYKTRTEFQKGSQGAYRAAYKNGWLKDYTWLIPVSKPSGYWNYENCYQEAKKYSTVGEFAKNNNAAYVAACKNKWIHQFDWLERKCKPNGYWDYEHCYEEAKKCKTKSEFEKYNSRAYAVARQNGWLKDYTWFEKGRISDKSIYIVYCYKDDETNSVYVGLTNNLKIRHRQHCKGHIKRGKLRFDIVYQYFTSINKKIPEPIILKDCLLAKEAQEYEKSYIKKFHDEGLNVLNIAKGGSLGAFGKWTKEKCYDEAKKYESKSDFVKNAGGAYNVARANGWLKDYTWFKELKKENGYWNNYEICYAAAKECSNKAEFGRKYGVAYYWARKNNWLKDYIWFPDIIKWNYDACRVEAKKYRTKSSFKINSHGAYDAAKRNGWLDEFFPKNK